MQNTTSNETANTEVSIRFKLVHALTEYDRKQSTKRHYNPYALGIYFERLEDVMRDINNGTEPRAAIMAGYSDRLVDVCLKALGLPITTDSEARNANIIYKPVLS